MIGGAEVATITCEVAGCDAPATVFTSNCARVAGAPYRWESATCGAHARPAHAMAEVGTFEVDGRAYTSGGASVDDTRAVVYVGAEVQRWTGDVRRASWRPLSERRELGAGPVHLATTWDGRVIGELAEVSRWRVPHGWVHAYRLTLTDGRRYAVRGSGAGMVASGRRMAVDAPRRP